MSQSQNKDLFHLGMLELILGAGIFIGVLFTLVFSHISYLVWDKIGRTIILIPATLGFTFVLISYIFGFKLRWSRPRLKWTVSTGAVAFGCLISIFCSSLRLGLVGYIYLFLSGMPLFLAGYGIVTDHRWSIELQQGLCFLFALAMFYLSFLSWHIPPRIFTFSFVLVGLSAIYCAMALHNLEIKKALRISFQVLLFCLLMMWLAILIIGIPNFINAEQRGRQKRTLRNLNIIAAAVDAYGEDHKTYPRTQNIHDLAKLLEPKYIKELPLTDGWGFTIEYYGTIFEDNVFQGYVIRSPGRDGKFELKDPTAYKEGPVAGFERDLVYAIGSMSQWPEGLMGP